MHKKRLVFLDLRLIRFPRTAIASILHRIAGVLLFLLIPLLLWALQTSLNSAGFACIQAYLVHPFAKVFLWLIGLPMIYHVIAGIRHLLMDIGLGESLEGGLFGATLVFIISVITAIFWGFYLW